MINIHIFSNQENRIWFYLTKTWTPYFLCVCSLWQYRRLTIAYLCLKHLLMLLCFLSNMAATPEQSLPLSFSCCMMKQSLRWYVDQSNPDFTHISDDINTKSIYFFYTCDCPQIPCLAPVMNLHWLLSCRGCKDPDTLWRTWFADNRVKNRVSSMNLVLSCWASQRGWLSGRAGADVALMAVEEAISDPDVRPCGRVA